MDENIRPKLAKCPACSSAFYIKTSEEHKLKTICPVCKKEVDLELNGENKNGDVGISESNSPSD